MKKISLIILYVLFCVQLNAQSKKPSPSIEFAKSIVQADLKKHLLVIAADSMEGRYTGSVGQKKAAKYIANHFKNIGLLPPVKTANGNSYYQEFSLVDLSWKEVYIKSNNEKFELGKDIYIRKHSNLKEETNIEFVFGGLGDESDIKNIDLNGKGIICFESEQEDDSKAKIARDKGAKAIIIIKGENKAAFKEAMEYNEYYFKRPIRELSNPKRKETSVFYISTELAAKFFNTTEKELLEKKKQPNAFKNINLTIKADRQEKINFSSENVLGFLEGTDKKDEILVITAHYDHVGKSDTDVFNGADDDGSGTVSVMEIAEAFAKAKAEGKGSRRSILFMTVAGEELGLYGSEYYCDIDPIFPLDKTVADLNIDMVGRIGGDYIKANEPNYIYLIGSDKLSTELHNLSEDANKLYTKLKLDYKYNDEKDPNRFYYRSDHYNFAKNNIPIIFYFNGVHDDYHQPTDEVEKIHFPKMEKIARLVFHTAWEIANRNEKPKVDKK